MTKMQQMHVILLALMLGSWIGVGRCRADEPMHILCIMADDLGWKDLGCQGNPVLTTPHLDRLAAGGARFTQAFAAAPVCSPTRAALITGLAPARLQITQHGADGPQFWPESRTIQPPKTKYELGLEESTTLAERLRAVGYATGFFGKWHLGDNPKCWPTEHGFDVNVGGCGFGGPPTYFDPYRIPTIEPREEGEYLTNRLADEVIQYMQRESHRPMFICLWTYNPHYPFEAPEDLVAPFKGREGPGLKNAIYGGQITALDNAVGRVLAELERLQLADKTLVIFTSDNGGWTGATDNLPLREGKGYLYDGGLRVPLIVRWPGVTQDSQTIERPVCTMDLAATMLDAAGVSLESGETLDGQSLRPVISGAEDSPRALYFHYPHWAFHKANRPASAIRNERYKLIHYYDDNSSELFDLKADPGEQENVAAREPLVVSSLQAELADWLGATNAKLPTARVREQGQEK